VKLLIIKLTKNKLRYNILFDPFTLEIFNLGKELFFIM